MFIREFVRGTYVADVNFVLQEAEFAEFLKAKAIRAVYIAPESNYETYKSQITNVNVYPFAGGFMENSLVLFPLTSEGDVGYFEKITDIKYS
jgi:hypothetical protein